MKKKCVKQKIDLDSKVLLPKKNIINTNIS